MSEIIVDICKPDEIKTHPNADALEIAIIKGWQVVVKKGEFFKDKLIVYFPPDCLLEEKLSDKLGVTKYLSKGRVKSIRLRSEPSHGFAVPYHSLAGELIGSSEGDNVAEKLGVKKWEPPPPRNHGVSNYKRKTRPENPLFPKYTSIENYRNYNKVIADDVIVTVSEKIHGTNSRTGYIFNEKLNEYEFIFGSHNVTYEYESSNYIYRKFIKKLIEKYEFLYKIYNFIMIKIVKQKQKHEVLYEMNLKNDNIKRLLTEVQKRYNAKSVAIYGEIYGDVQDLKYGHKPNECSYRAFDISIDLKYINNEDFIKLCNEFNVDMVPVKFTGTLKELKEIGFEKLIEEGTKASKTEEINIAEGLVIKPIVERYDHKVGRVILKYISDKYYTRKDGTENH